MSPRGDPIRDYPHKPDGEYLTALRERLQKFLVQAKGVRPREMRHRHGEFFRIMGEEALKVACLLHLEEQPAAKILEYVRPALADLTLSYELGYDAEPEDVIVHFGAALAAGDRASARFFATLPPEKWGFPNKEDREIDSWFVKASFALLLGEASELAVSLDFLDGLIFENDLPEEVAHRKAEFENTFRLLEAVSKKDAKEFVNRLLIRQDLRGETLQKETEHLPLELVDLAGLGWCRMALDAGMKFQARHAYLPLELLEVPSPGAPPVKAS